MSLQIVGFGQEEMLENTNNYNVLQNIVNEVEGPQELVPAGFVPHYTQMYEYEIENSFYLLASVRSTSSVVSCPSNSTILRAPPIRIMYST